MEQEEIDALNEAYFQIIRDLSDLLAKDWTDMTEIETRRRISGIIADSMRVSS